MASQKLKDLLSPFLSKVEKKYSIQQENIHSLWPQIVGPQFASYSRIDRYDEGIVYVIVNNSSLLSLLQNPHDKKRIISAFRAKAPGLFIKNIYFRIGT